MGAKQSYGAVGRGDTLSFEPETLKVITDPKHPLYDARIEREPNEALILSIMRHGVLVPLLIYRDGNDVYIDDGRQRWKAALEANKRLKKAGGKPVVLPCVWKRGDEKTLYEIAVTTNALRTGDSPLESARKMQHLANLNGNNLDEVAVSFGCTLQTVKNHLALLECAPSVQRAVEAGKVAATVATKLSRLKRDEQTSTLEKMIESGATKGAAAQKAIKKKGEITAADKAKPLSAIDRKRVLDALISVAATEKNEVIHAMIATFDLINGDASALKKWPEVAALVIEALAMPAKKPKAEKAKKREKKAA